MVAKGSWITLLLALSLPSAYAVGIDDSANVDDDTHQVQTISWQQMSDQQRSELIKRFQDIKKLPDQERADLQQRMNWFSQLPKSQQQKMRDAWQNMSASERAHWRTKLLQANPEQRDDLRQKILDKYD